MVARLWPELIMGFVDSISKAAASATKVHHVSPLSPGLCESGFSRLLGYQYQLRLVLFLGLYVENTKK